MGAVALGPRNVWAFGSSATIFPRHGNISASVFHWNGSKWRGYGFAHGRLLSESISASSRTNVWMAGVVWRRKTQRAAAYRWNGAGWHKATRSRALISGPVVAAYGRSDVWFVWHSATASHVAHWEGSGWHSVTPPADVAANPWNVVPDGEGGYWFGDMAIMTGSTWTSVPGVLTSGDLVRIPGTHSFLQPAGAIDANSAFQKPTIYRFDL